MTEALLTFHDLLKDAPKAWGKWGAGAPVNRVVVT